MPISEAQLDTWSHQGAVTTSSTTYATIKAAIQRPGLAYSGLVYRVFLQGSYGNDTNIHGVDSDVDVVICLESTYHGDLSALSVLAKMSYHADHPGPPAYQLSNFKNDVRAALDAAFPYAVHGGSKALHIAANGARRKADVIVATNYFQYSMYVSDALESHTSGITFQTAGGKMLVNYPAQHSVNCTAKHQATGNRFKPTVRIFKNIRNRLIDNGLIGAGTVPSYFLEGLLSNVPNNLFVASRQATVSGILTYLQQANRANFMCANGLHPLHTGDPDLCWQATQCTAFINTANIWWLLAI
ncbi:MAG TPA: nucleotidyltransferase [Gammaproteobacteria bacterium]